MMKRIVLSFLILLVVVSACKQEKPKFPVVLSLSSFHELVHPAYLINPDSIRQYVRVNLSNANDTMAWDSAMMSYYAADSAALFWMKDGVGQYADSLLYWLENSHRHGLNPALFNVSGIRTDLERFRSLQLHEDETINHLLARLEYGLTSSYLFYTCGLKYGFISPVQLLNNQEEDVKKKNDTEKQKEPYPIPLKKCSKEFALEALASLGQNPFAAFRQAQPTLLKVGERHRIIPLIAGRLMQTGELKQQVSGDTLTSVLLEAVNEFRLTNRLSTDNSIGTYTIRYLNRPLAYYKDHLLINLERARWQYKSEKGSKYVIGNIAAFMLQAFNEEVDSILEMRICCGSVRNKTPLLYSKIYYMELNPYWNVPQNIIRKEIIPSYRRDTTYFTRNRMKVYDKNGNRVNPHDIKWAKYTAGVPFTVKQDNKEGNSLGRIIFRFPNPYAVYLHDTPSRWAFNRSNRAVSHGCVRLERALDFAFFLLEKPDELLEDRIRIAMDIAPESDEGKKLNRSEAYRELKHYSLKEAIPLFLDYQTMYLAADGNLSYCEDIYKYDDPLLEALNKLNHK